MDRVFTTEVVVRSYELDSFGHVNNAVYLNYLEAARCDCLRQVGLSFHDFERWGAYPLVAEAHLRYRAPAFADDVLTVRTWITSLKRASFGMGFEIRREEALVLTAEMRFLFVDANGKPRRVPAEFARAFGGPGPDRTHTRSRSRERPKKR